mgnify:FL=1
MNMWLDINNIECGDFYVKENIKVYMNSNYNRFYGVNYKKTLKVNKVVLKDDEHFYEEEGSLYIIKRDGEIIRRLYTVVMNR